MKEGAFTTEELFHWETTATTYKKYPKAPEKEHVVVTFGSVCTLSQGFIPLLQTTNNLPYCVKYINTVCIYTVYWVQELLPTYHTYPFDSSQQCQWPWPDLPGHSWGMAVLDRTRDGRRPAICPPHIYTLYSLLSMLHWPEGTKFIVGLWREAFQLWLAFQNVM